jgi:D-alanyl-D-alanine carboxypeptidase (penicillin-binding protein 5/6)
MGSYGAGGARAGVSAVAPYRPWSALVSRAVVLLSLLVSFTFFDASANAAALRPLPPVPAPATTPARAPGKPTAPPATVALPPSAAYVLVDVGTGNVLAGDNEHLRLPPASLTKILTALIAVTYLRSDARVPGTSESVRAYPNDVGIEKGVPWSLHDVLESLLVLSANDAAYALAQRISGSLAAFAEVMERSAKQLGMTDAPVFHDPAGLDGTEGFEGGNLVSARDLAIAGRDLLEVPELARIVVQDSYHFVDPTGTAHYLPSMNNLFLESYPGAIGIKTGFTDKAGSCIMAAARRNGRTMLAVVMNGYNPTQSAIDLLNEGFQTPVAAEAGTDRLPPPALPSPARAPGPLSLRRSLAHHMSPARGAQAKAGAATGRAPGAPGPRRDGPVGPRSRATAIRGIAVPAPPRHGLSSVLDTWPAQVLLLLTGAAALVALWELRSLQQLNGHGRRSYEPRTARSSPGAPAGTIGRRGNTGPGRAGGGPGGVRAGEAGGVAVRPGAGAGLGSVPPRLGQ